MLNLSKMLEWKKPLTEAEEQAEIDKEREDAYQNLHSIKVGKTYKETKTILINQRRKAITVEKWTRKCTKKVLEMLLGGN
jgi:hypothetical protein